MRGLHAFPVRDNRFSGQNLFMQITRPSAGGRWPVVEVKDSRLIDSCAQLYLSEPCRLLQDGGCSVKICEARSQRRQGEPFRQRLAELESVESLLVDLR